mgnify:CR=1 FL=1
MDDDDIGYVRRNKVVHYGSLANNEQLGNNQKNAASAGSNVQVSTDFILAPTFKYYTRTQSTVALYFMGQVLFKNAEQDRAEIRDPTQLNKRWR